MGGSTITLDNGVERSVYDVTLLNDDRLIILLVDEREPEKIAEDFTNFTTLEYYNAVSGGKTIYKGYTNINNISIVMRFARQVILSKETGADY